MKTDSLSKIAAALFCFGIANFAIASNDTDSVVTAVFSRSFNGYARPAQADGSNKPLTYVIAKGGYAPGLGADPSIDDVKFGGLVRVLGKYLAKQGYYPAKNATKADLMLVIHWGKTKPFNDGVQRNLMDEGLRGFETLQQLGEGIGAAPGEFKAEDDVPPSAATYGQKESQKQVEAAMEEGARDQMTQGLYQIRMAQDLRISADTYNANLLGYSGELRQRDNPSLYAGAGTAYDDLLNDIETERYYVAVTAYDFQEAVQHQQKKGLWRTVTSISARGNRFDERLIAMVEKASRYFGQDSGRLIRQFQYTPHITFGELKLLGVVDDQPAPKK